MKAHNGKQVVKITGPMFGQTTKDELFAVERFVLEHGRFPNRHWKRYFTKFKKAKGRP